MVQGVINIQNWIPKYILGYVIYMAFIITIISNVTVVNAEFYDITPEQQEILLAPSTNPITFLDRALILSSISSGYAGVGILTAILTFVFFLAVAKALKEIIPIFPS